MNAATFDDYRWLVGAEAAPWLEHATASDRSLVSLTRTMRRHLSLTRTHLVLEQVELRGRAREKFTRADRMLFTHRGLQQATDQRIAEYKATRFAAPELIADLCCGIGGDLLALSDRGPVVGVDRDPIVALLAAENCQCLAAREVEVRTADVRQLKLAEFVAWHVDPDRRSDAGRTTRVELHEPSKDVIDRMLTSCQHGAVKLSPAAGLTQDWQQRAELEWISNRRECKQLVVWFGSLARHPARRAATMLATSDKVPARTVVGIPQVEIPVARSVSRYLFEPDPAVLAAALTGALAADHNLSCLAPNIAYLTGDRPVADPALAAFEITDVLPFDMKRLKALVRHRHIGRLEVKRRGIDEDPARIRHTLSGPGDQSATLLIARTGSNVTAMLATRLPIIAEQVPKDATGSGPPLGPKPARVEPKAS